MDINQKKQFSLSSLQIVEIDERINLIKSSIPKEFSRKPRSLKELDRWKATELRQFLCYTGIFVLHGILPPVYYNHFLLLFCAMRILCDKIECIRNNECAAAMLKRFVNKFGDLYGEHSVSYNVHNLIHIPVDVLNYGNV